MPRFIASMLALVVMTLGIAIGIIAAAPRPADREARLTKIFNQLECVEREDTRGSTRCHLRYPRTEDTRARCLEAVRLEAERHCSEIYQ